MSSFDVFGAAQDPTEKTERTNRSVSKNGSGSIQNNQKENQFLSKRYSNINALKHMTQHKRNINLRNLIQLQIYGNKDPSIEKTIQLKFNDVGPT